MNQYERHVSCVELGHEDLREIVQQILDHLGLRLVVEETPDYKAFRLERRP